MHQHMTVDVPDDDYAYLETCARLRHISVSRLLLRLVRVVAHDQLVLSVLDDNSQIAPRLPDERNSSKYRYRKHQRHLHHV